MIRRHCCRPVSRSHLPTREGVPQVLGDVALVQVHLLGQRAGHALRQDGLCGVVGGFVSFGFVCRGVSGCVACLRQGEGVINGPRPRPRTRGMRPEVRLELAPRVLQLPLVQVDVGLGADEGVLQQVLGRRAELGVLDEAPVVVITVCVLFCLFGRVVVRFRFLSVRRGPQVQRRRRRGGARTGRRSRGTRGRRTPPRAAPPRRSLFALFVRSEGGPGTWS